MRKKSRNSLWKSILKYRFVYLLLLPVLLYFTVFSYAPLAMGVVQSFLASRLIGPPAFNGLQNYLDLFADYQFWQAFYNSLFMGVFTALFTFGFSLLLALALNEVRTRVVKSCVQSVSYLPHLFSWTVVGGIWVSIFSTNGLLNSFLRLIGAHPGAALMASRGLARWVMVFTGTWQSMGYYAILFLAAIVTIDPGMYEAAQIDGAGRLRQIGCLTLPKLVPTMKVIALLSVMGLLRNFDQVFVMGNSMIQDKVDTLLLYIYNKGILQFQTGLATAAASVVLAATVLITFLLRRLLRYDSSY